MFTSQTYQKRRKNLKNLINKGIALFVGNVDVSFNYPSNIYPFRQDSNFLYFFGIDQPGLSAIIDFETGEEIIFGDELTIDDIIWMGKLPTILELSKQVGVEKVLPISQLEIYLGNAFKLNRKVHFLPPYRTETKLKIAEVLGIRPNFVKQYASIELIKAVVGLRSIKEENELIEIEKAVNITRQMHIKAMQMAKEGVKEQEITGAITGITWANEGFLSFPAIVTINGQTLHNNYYGNTLTKGKMLVCDAGAETYMHYAGDITRTTPVGGKFDQKQKNIYQIVLEANKAVISNAKPGIFYKEMHLLAAKIIASRLKELGLMKGNTDEAVEQGAHALFFPHGLGHMMGLDVHDMEDLGENNVGYDKEVQRASQFGLAFLRMARRLQEGFVVTVEPGLYFIPDLIDLWKSENKFEQFINYSEIENYRDFGGVRIEDDILITKSGCKVIGEPIPKEIEEIEQICK